jgi:hypothetical protein
MLPCLLVKQMKESSKQNQGQQKEREEKKIVNERSIISLQVSQTYISLYLF